MKVEVRLINERGVGMTSRQRHGMPVYRGILRLNEQRNHYLGRTVVTARLLSATDGSEGTVIPELLDASVLFLRDSDMRIRGFEVLDGVQYAQTWDVKVS